MDLSHINIIICEKLFYIVFQFSVEFIETWRRYLDLPIRLRTVMRTPVSLYLQTVSAAACAKRIDLTFAVLQFYHSYLFFKIIMEKYNKILYDVYVTDDLNE